MKRQFTLERKSQDSREDIFPSFTERSDIQLMLGLLCETIEKKYAFAGLRTDGAVVVDTPENLGVALSKLDNSMDILISTIAYRLNEEARKERERLEEERKNAQQ